MRISAIVQCKNEQKILPFFLDYYTSFCDEIVFFDGNSTDSSHDIIKSYIRNKHNCNIELRITDSIGVLDNTDEHTIKEELNCNYNLSSGWNRNHGFKTLHTSHINDWILVVDCDEFFYHKDGVRNKLEQLQKEGVSIPYTVGYNMVSKQFPEYVKDQFIFEQLKTGFYFKDQCKTTAFDSKKIKEINFEPGCHIANPVGDCVYSDEADEDKLKILHYKFLSIEYLNNIAKFKHEDMSEIQHRNGWGHHYKELSTVGEEWFDMLIKDSTEVI